MLCRAVPTSFLTRCCPSVARAFVSSNRVLLQSALKPEVYYKGPSKESGSDYRLPHPIWKGEFVDDVKVAHTLPKKLIDKAALYTIKTIRFNFDWMSGYSFGEITEKKWLRRILFLETIAAIPGSIAGVLRHLSSLRRMGIDNGWIHTLYEEAENERMHMLTAIALRPPSLAMRGAVFLTQGLFFNFYFLAYLISPHFCHRLVGYLEEEAVKTYTTCLKAIDDGKVWTKTPAPPIAIKYWKLAENATMRDVIAHIRADEAHHALVNHTFANMDKSDPNPFPPGY